MKTLSSATTYGKISKKPGISIVTSGPGLQIVFLDY